MTTPSGKKSMWHGKKNNPKNSGHYVPLQRPRAAHALRTDQHKTLTSNMAQTGHTRALDTERDSQVTHGDLDHGVRVLRNNPNFHITIRL